MLKKLSIEKSYNNVYFIIPDILDHAKGENLLNYSSSNVLTISQFLLLEDDQGRRRFIIVAHSQQVFLELNTLVNKFKYPSRIKVLNKYDFSGNFFVAILQLIKYFYLLSSSNIILSSSPLIQLPYKSSQQVHVALNYYSPFKSDSLWSLSSNSIDYVIAASDIAAKTDSQVSKIPLNRYKILGFPRNDHILRPRFTKREVFRALNIPIKSQLLVFAPTHRVTKNDDGHRTLFGVSNPILGKIEKLLKERDVYVLVASHSNGPSHSISPRAVGHSRFKFFQNSSEISTYDILPHSDGFILDYSSIYFDVLLCSKRVVFNFIDIEEFRNSRGFAYDPIESVCAGKIAYSEAELVSKISDLILNKKCLESDIRHSTIRSLMHKYIDDSSSQRVLAFLRTLESSS